MRNIKDNRYLVPSIQREFEWSHGKIEWLFDSIMRDYPISSFLFWRVEGDTKNQYKFYQLIRNYKEKYDTHNIEFGTTDHNDFTAILDGQQRLTSLYIGLRGSYAYRKPRLREENSERVYPTRKLYLNLLKPMENEEDGRIFEFKFLTDDEAKSGDGKWFEVSKILGLSDDYKFNEYLDKHGLKSNKFTYKSLSTLKNVIHTKPIINFFLEKEQDIEKALNIFIRINSGGEPLNFSDLVMSIAVANWKTKNAREEIHGLTDSVRDKGFNISKDFVLKSFLYLHSKDIKFKATNFSKSNAVKFEDEWEQVHDTILSVIDLIKSYGFTESTLTSKNSLIPIIYYLYHRNIYQGFHTRMEHEADRAVIKKWLHASLVKRLFGGASDGILSQIRRAFTNDVLEKTICEDMTEFPVLSISNEIRRDAGISDEFIEDLLLTQKDDSYAFSLLALVFPNLDYKNNDFHKDHLHPQARYDDLREVDKEKHGWKTYNSLINLQMLDANENISKQDSDLGSWVEKEVNPENREAFLQKHHIPNISLELNNFDEFVTKRTTLLADELKKVLV